jgi:hypothetical protein
MKEAIVTSFDVLFQHIPGKIDKRHENPQVRIAYLGQN